MSIWSQDITFQPYPLTENAPLPNLAFINLDNWALVELTGEDKKSYLQGQVTCDVVSLLENEHTLGAHCDAKGKMRTIFRLFHHKDGYGWLQRRSVMSTQLPELKKYAIFSKVNITESTDILLGVVGNQATAWIEQQTQETGKVRKITGGTALQLDDNRWILAVTQEHALRLLQEKSDISCITHELWEQQEITAGFPAIEAETELEFIPQAVNLQALQGISFTKGCYTGQETVARAKYRGINKRAMFLVSGQSETQPQAGDVLERQVGENWRQGGAILTAYQYQDKHTIALVVLPNDLEVDTAFRLANEPNTEWKMEALPYSLEEA